MKYFFTIILSVFALSFTQIQAQRTKPVLPEGKGETTIDKSKVRLTRQNWTALPQVNPSVFDPPAFNAGSVGPLVKPVKGQVQLAIVKDEVTKLPTWIKGNPDIPAMSSRSATDISQIYLNAIKSLIQIERPVDEFALQSVREDKKGHQHIRLQQMYQGLKVFGSAIILHENAGNVYLFNGRYHATPALESVTAQVSETEAKNIVQTEVETITSFKTLNTMERQLMAGDQLEAELVIYYLSPTSDAQLVWHITARPNVVAHYEYFVDANTGTVIQHYNGICQIHGGRCAAAPHGRDHAPELALEMSAAEKSFDFNMLPPPPGPEVANATDLTGANRTINTYEDGGTFFMIDASRSMFNANLSDIPNEPVGAIWTIDGNNESPQNNSFQPSHVTSGNNNWNDQTAVSAHYNGGEAYEYFKNTFNRNSINGQGGTIVSLINITDSDGSQMDNAYWNGNAMFYGNGNQAFDAPLAKALDVAGHEMAHGVIQSTANLVYQDEPGALNESFADIFGAMIDRDDWRIGEEVASSVFPSGTMRDMSNPHNGGNSLNDFYWQPDHYSERFTGSQDNGGVHINSGIPNHAYYLFATSSSVGKEIAEQVFYTVLEDYLTASSNFADLRNAVVEVAQNDYGTSVANAAAAAFDAVGIGGSGGSGPPPEIEENEGDDYILYSDSGLSNIMNLNGNSSPSGQLSTNNHLSKPSVSDNGSIINYVGADNHIWEIVIDWTTGMIDNEYTLSTDPIWRNVATSKDGSKVAAVTTDMDNLVFVIDFNTGASEWFELYNPTFSQDVTTGDVDFADVLEFDATGEFLMYDARSTISGDFGADITYWDIGFMRVWSNNANTFAGGEISKLFSGLPENVSVGNPTFAKNSPYIIALDLIEGTDNGTNYSVIGVNLETFDQGVIWENNTLGYPSYSRDDNQVLFSNSYNNVDIIGKVGLASDKINSDGNNGELIVEDAIWGVWYATGDRILTDTKEPIIADKHLFIYPNPFNSLLTLEYDALNSGAGTIQIFDMIGKLKYSENMELSSGANKRDLNVGKLAPGTYLLQLSTADGVVLRKLSKF